MASLLARQLTRRAFLTRTLARAEDDDDGDNDDGDGDDDNNNNDDSGDGSSGGSGDDDTSGSSGGSDDDGSGDGDSNGSGSDDGDEVSAPTSRNDDGRSDSGRGGQSYPEGFLSQRDVQRAIRNGDAMSLNNALSRLRSHSSGTPIDTRIFSTGSRLVYVFTVRESNGNVSRLGLDARSGSAVRVR